MKYKVKFRISVENGKKSKFSINIEEAASFVLNPASLGASDAPVQTACVLRVADGQLFASGENGSKIRVNNREGLDFQLRPGDFVDAGTVAIEFLEVPTREEEDDGGTRFLDISEKAPTRGKPALASKPEPEPKLEPKHPERSEAVSHPKTGLHSGPAKVAAPEQPSNSVEKKSFEMASDLPPVTDAGDPNQHSTAHRWVGPAPIPAPAAQPAPSESTQESLVLAYSSPQEVTEADEISQGEDTESELSNFQNASEVELLQKVSDLNAQIQLAAKKGKKGKRELRRLKRVRRQVEMRRIAIASEMASETAKKTAEEALKRTASETIKDTIEPSTSATRVRTPVELMAENPVKTSSGSLGADLQSKSTITEGTNSRLAASALNSRPQTNPGSSHRPLNRHPSDESALARKLFSQSLGSKTGESRSIPQPKALRWMVGVGAAAGIAMVIALAMKGRAVKLDEVAAESPYQTIAREPSSQTLVAPSDVTSPGVAPVAAATAEPTPVPMAPMATVATVATVVETTVEATPLPTAVPTPVATPIALRPSPQSVVRASAPTVASYAKDRFFTSIKAGDLKTVKQLVSNRSVDVNFTLDREKTPLMIAAGKGHLSIVKYFISMRANLNAQDSEGTTALMWATHRGQKSIVQYLLKRGADASIRRDDGDRAIDIARRWNQNEIVRMLRNGGANRKVAGKSSRERKKK